MSFGTEIYDFITDTNNEESINIDDYGNATFKAQIKYTFRNQTLSSYTDVKIIRNGYDDGKVSMRLHNFICNTLKMNSKLPKNIRELAPDIVSTIEKLPIETILVFHE